MKTRIIFIILLLRGFFGSGLFAQTATDDFNSGLKESQMQDYDSAIADYGCAIYANPKFSEAYINRGLAEFKKSDFDAAIADFSRALEIGPQSAYLYNLLGNTNYNKFDFAGAIADYNHALEIDPKNAYAYNGRGLAESAMGGKESAASVALYYFNIFAALLFAYMIFAPAAKRETQRSRFYDRYLAPYDKFEPAWYLIAGRVLLALGIIALLFGIAEHNFKPPQIRLYMHRYYLMFGDAFVGVAVFMCFAYRERKRCKQAAMVKINPTINP